MTSTQSTVSIHIIKMMLVAGHKAGIEPAISLNAIHLDNNLLHNPDARVPLKMENALWEFLANRSQDIFFGLHAGMEMTPGAGDVMDYAIRTSDNLQQAIENLCRYNRLLHDEAIIDLVVVDNRAMLCHYFRSDPRGASWQAADFTLSSFVAIGRAITGGLWKIKKIKFQHAEPESISKYQEYFSCPLEFLCDKNSIEFDKQLLKTTIPDSDPALNHILCRQADELLKGLPNSGNIIENVKEQLVKFLRHGNPGIENIADSLNMTPRTLQRKLKKLNTTHESLLDAMRKDLARHYIQDNNLGVSEATYLLGYSEPSAFHRAFKRWFYMSPGEFRLQAK